MGSSELWQHYLSTSLPHVCPLERQLLSETSPSGLQQWLGGCSAQLTRHVHCDYQTLSTTCFAPSTALLHCKSCWSRQSSQVPALLSEHCCVQGRRVVAIWSFKSMLLQRTQTLFTSRASVPSTCLFVEVVLTPSNRQTKYFILNGFRVAIFDRFNNRTLPN